MCNAMCCITGIIGVPAICCNPWQAWPQSAVLIVATRRQSKSPWSNTFYKVLGKLPFQSLTARNMMKSPESGSRNDQKHDDDDISVDSFHSVDSATNAMSSTSSLQDIELAEPRNKPQHEVPPTEGLAKAKTTTSKSNTRGPSPPTTVPPASVLPRAATTPATAPKAREESPRLTLYQEFLQEMVNVRRRVTKSTGMNQVVLCILFTEAAERFTYYGFRASLVLYFTQELKMDDTTAISVFAFASYVSNFTPIFGAVLGDGRWGRYRTIVTFGLVYWIGMIILTHSAFLGNASDSQLKIKRIATYIGLALICTGTGGLKPCVSIFGADQVNIKDEEDQSKIQKGSGSSTSTKTTLSTNTLNSEEQEKVRSFFSFFSMCINLGAVASFVVIPFVKGRYGYGAAFLLPTVLICLAIIVFLSQSHRYRYRPNNVHGSSLFTTLRLCLWLLHNNVWSNKFVSDNFPTLEPGPVPLPSVVPTSSGDTVVEGLNVHVANTTQAGTRPLDDHTSVSSMSLSMRSLSRSVSRSISSSRSHSRSRSVSRTRDPSLGHPNASRSRSKGDRRHDALDAPQHGGLDSSSPSVATTTSLQTTDRYLAQQLSDAARALNVLPIFAMLPCFWMLYDQQGSVWTLQASRMNLHGIMQPEQINVLNPMGLFVMIPLFDKVIYPALERREIDISPLRRMGWGMILVSFAFFISGIVEYAIDYRIQNDLSHITVFWQIPQISLMTVAEIFISVTGLEFAYSVSPDRLKSFVMAAYLMTIAKGDFWGGVLYSTIFRELNQAFVLHIFAMAMMCNLAFYGCVVQSWEMRHGLVSWDLFDKVLDTESKKRPYWESHHRQNLCITTIDAGPADVLVADSSMSASEGSLGRQERGRARWRPRLRRKSKKSKSRSRKEKSSKSRKDRKKKGSSQSSSKKSRGGIPSNHDGLYL